MVLKSRLLQSAVAIALMVTASSAARASAFDTEIESLRGLLAYYTFTTSSQGNSVVKGYTGTLENGATVGGAGSGPPVNDPASSAVVLANGTGGMQDMVSAGKKPLLGKISSRGSIVAWINLGDLPSNQGRIFSIAGESQQYNDFDLQIDANNLLCFYTDNGSATCAPDAFTVSDIGVWHLIVATFKASGARVLYVDGKQVATSIAGGHTTNMAPFYVGESTVFTGRYFVGSIGDVAEYSTALSAKSARAIWAARQ